jgi:hypothetical protein
MIFSWPDISACPPPPEPHPVATLWRVVIGYPSGCVEKHVWAKSAKAAFVAACESVPENDALWSAPGWNFVNVHPENSAVIIEGVRRG